MSYKHLCNLVIPGAAKSGTSALHEALGYHPQINMSSAKEPHYFSIENRFEKKVEYHNSLFESGSGKIIYGESSTSYMIWPEAIKRIAKDLNNPKILFVLRDPVERTFSHYRWRYSLGLEKRSFYDALMADGYGFNPNEVKGFGFMSYIQFSQYSKYCPLWIQEFGAENCLFITSDDLKKKQLESLSRVYSFLGVENIPLKDDIRINETSRTVKMVSSEPKLATALLPARLRRSPWMKAFWKWYSLKIVPDTPHSMKAEERDFLERVLAEDIQFYQMVQSKPDRLVL